jgi:hypothetical protein
MLLILFRSPAALVLLGVLIPSFVFAMLVIMAVRERLAGRRF